MNRWKSILCVLIVLWLPLQGYAAVAMPFCAHGIGAASDLGGTTGHSQHHHDGHAHHMDHAGAPTDGAATSHANHSGNHHAGGLACNDCGACHLACAPVISTIVPVHLSNGTFALESAAADPARFFYSEPLQHPPLTALL